MFFDWDYIMTGKGVQTNKYYLRWLTVYTLLQYRMGRLVQIGMASLLPLPLSNERAPDRPTNEELYQNSINSIYS